MDADAPRGLLRYFSDLVDPRPGHNVLHRLNDMLAIAIVAVICGAEDWVDVALFGRSKEKWLKTFLPLPHGIPSHDTFTRLFAALDPQHFEKCFMDWTAAVAHACGGRLIAFDGKTIRRSFDKASSRSAIHMISAWCGANRLVLGQLAVEQKSNEITAVPSLLALLDLAGAVVMLDAMHCQKETAAAIVKGGGHYVIQVKGNQQTLHDELKVTLDEAILLNFEGVDHDKVRDCDKGHGRVEVRRCWCTSDVSWVPRRKDWAGLASVAVVESTRWIDGRQTTERRYYISSLPGDDAKAMLAAVRGHWGIENQLHWCLDVSFREDASRLRKGHGAENFSRLRRLALNLLKRETTVKAGLKAKSKTCGWDHDYLLKVLTQT